MNTYIGRLIITSCCTHEGVRGIEVLWTLLNIQQIQLYINYNYTSTTFTNTGTLYIHTMKPTNKKKKKSSNACLHTNIIQYSFSFCVTTTVTCIIQRLQPIAPSTCYLVHSQFYVSSMRYAKNGKLIHINKSFHVPCH